MQVLRVIERLHSANFRLEEVSIISHYAIGQAVRRREE